MMRFVFCIILSQLLIGETEAQLPEGFVDELVTDGVETPVGVEFVDTHLAYIWNQQGLIYLLEHDQVLEIPMLDISDEVSGTGDHGMLGLAIDPDFKQNGYLYLSYVVDPHYLQYFGTDQYDPPEFDEWGASIGRVTRYQVDVLSKKEILENSRTILLGDSIHNGIPVLAPAHGVGGLDFGTDGTLLVGTGDGTTWVGDHTGGADYKEFGFDSLGKVLGIIDELQDVGSYRSQMLESYNGKILRIDPMTGLGLPSNPFYDSTRPHAAKSKVWALGLRSPFRLRVRPGSGSQNPADGKPGSIYVGDVGSNQFEELNILSSAGRNLGWPSFEGHFPNLGYQNQQVKNKRYQNPYFDTSAHCHELVGFEDLIVSDNRSHQFNWANPCDTNRSLQEFAQTFVHHRPALSYGNSVNNPNLVLFSGFDDQGVALGININDPESPIEGNSFDGISSVVGDFYLGDVFPEQFKNTYFHGDFSGWIRNLSFDSHEGTDEIHRINSFAEETSSIVYLRYNKFDQSLYYVVLDYSDRPNLYQIRKIRFTDNPRPVAVIETDTLYGFSPLNVYLSAAKSYDPAGEQLHFNWIIDDRDTFRFRDSTLIFSIENQPKNIPIRLIVTDESGLSDEMTQTISLNNSPPIVKITSIEPDQGYRLDADFFDLSLEAEAFDSENALGDLTFRWEIKLKHNDHFHVEFVDTAKSSSVTLPALPSTELDMHSYVIGLEVSDPLGLTGYHEVTVKPILSTSTSPYLAQSGIFVYPSPARQQITIASKNPILTRFKNVQLLDATGRTIDMHTSINLPYDLNVNALQPGSYFLFLVDHLDQKHRLRFVKTNN